MNIRILLSVLFLSTFTSCQTEDDLVDSSMNVGDEEATDKVEVFKKSVQLTPLINEKSISLK